METKLLRQCPFYVMEYTAPDTTANLLLQLCKTNLYRKVSWHCIMHLEFAILILIIASKAIAKCGFTSY